MNVLVGRVQFVWTQNHNLISEINYNLLSNQLHFTPGHISTKQSEKFISLNLNLVLISHLCTKKYVRYILPCIPNALSNKFFSYYSVQNNPRP